MHYQNLYPKKEKNELIRNIMITRKKRAEIINNFCQKETRFVDIDENKLMLGLMTHEKIHPFIKKVFSYFVDTKETESAVLTRAQTFRGLKIPFAYFSERESIMYALSSYLHNYDKREYRAWRINELIEQACAHKKTKDMATFLKAIIIFNNAINEDFDQVKLANAYVLMKEIDKDSPLYDVAVVFIATYCVLIQDFQNAYDIISDYRKVYDNEIYKKFEDKIATYIPRNKNVYNFYDYVRATA